MKLLNGRELAEFIKERQAREVRRLRQAVGVQPKLAIIQCKDDPVINTYVRLKQDYGDEMQVEVDVYKIAQKDAKAKIETLNNDDSVHGIIVQLPLEDVTETDQILNFVSPQKDVDALGENPDFDPATPMAIQWLLAGYNIDLRGKNIVLVGKGKLVGAPLEKMLTQSEIPVVMADRTTEDLASLTQNADIIITATGSPGVITSDMVKPKAVVVDAGVASESGKTVGDVAPELYQRDDITITPQKGGVGPLTVCALFDNVLRAARAQATE